MDDPLLNSPSDPAVAELDQQVRSLRHLLKLVLISVFIVTAGLSLFLYRQTTLMKRQIDGQQRALLESHKAEREVVLKGIEKFRQYGARDPIYASNVLSRFDLSPLMPTNVPPAPAAPAPVPAKR